MAGLLVLQVPSGPPEAAATTPSGGEVSNEPISAGELLSGAAPDSLTANARFAPLEGSRAAGQPFLGTLDLEGAVMTTLASDNNGQLNPDGFTSNPIYGKDTSFFPDVSLSFFTSKGHLVPTTQDVVRNGVLPGARSFWDIIVQPGRVWSDPVDRGWNRAAFPFALVNGVDGELHSGLALFLYRGSQVSPVRFQVVQQGAPYLIADYFSAWGVTDASYRRGGIDNLGQRTRTYEKELADKLPVKSWSELDDAVSSDPLVQFGLRNPQVTTNPNVNVAAVVDNGVLYRTDCRTAAGPYPYCDDMRQTIHSITKAASLGIARLRLAQKYGTGFLDEPIANYLVAARQPAWADVTFLDMANMASGHSITEEGDYGNYDRGYTCWLITLADEDDRNEGALAFPRIREPGTVYNYQDQDAYLAGAALDAFLKSKEGPDASIWKMLEREVYRPIGIHHAPGSATVEEGGSPGQPLWSHGYYPTLDELAKIGLLMNNHGAWNGRPILHRGLVDSLLPTTTQPPQDRSPGPYYLNFSISKVGSWWVPNHGGWGGSRLALLPGDLITIAVANHLGASSGWPPKDYVDEWPTPDPCNADGSSR